jgi:hypothetical protein
LVVAAPRSCAEPPKSTFSAEQLRFYDAEVLPILKANCYKCHGMAKPKGGLLLSSREAILAGGESGPAVDLKTPGDSLLLKAVRHQDELKMPPNGKLPTKDIDVLARWIKAGMPMPAAATVAKKDGKGGLVTEEAKKYWAYQPIRRPAIPAVRNSGWVRDPIDALILAKLEEKGLRPAAPAEKVALVRRVYYDLIGLPPTPEEVDAFVQDSSPSAYEKLIDKLLDSPHYGEKWGRHWLDLVRYAETNGYERDGPKPFAWRYRDYVIKSFNQDKPFDRFIREQLAGDEIDRDNPDAIIATGYYRLGLWDDEPADPLEARYFEFDDWVATTAQVFLGMTMNCARCHDHKIDPIPQADYYRLLAFFQDVPHYSDTRDIRSSLNMTDITPKEKRERYEAELKEREVKLAELTEKLTAIENEAIKKMPAEEQNAAEGPDRPQVVRKVPRYLEGAKKAEYESVKAFAAALKKKPFPSQDLALSVNHCLKQPPQTFVMIRGNPHSPGVTVEPGFPQVLGFPDPKIAEPGPGARSSGRRTLLANWVASKENPLTARVIVNRLWQHHFGRGIVASTNDFGQFGVPPTHPELLDWLASELLDGGWKLKPLHRKILLSNAYRMSATASETGLKLDPGNQWFWRFPVRRLTAEEMRDSFLAVSGMLNLTASGPSVYPKIPKEVLAGQSRPGEGWPTSPPEEANRRSVYVHIKRSLLVPVLSMHDQADTDSSCPVRYTTTVPTQALGMLNGEFANSTAAAFAERLMKECPGNLQTQVRRAIRLTTGRIPGDDEVQTDVEFMRELRQRMGEKHALQKYCLILLNANEFVYLD